MNETIIRSLVRAILKESIDIQTDDVYVLLSMIRRFYIENELYNWMNSFDRFISGPSAANLDQSIKSDLDDFYGAMSDVFFDKSFIGHDDYLKVVKELSTASDGKVNRAVFSKIMNYSSSLIKDDDSILDLFDEIGSHLNSVKQGDVILRKIQFLMNKVAVLDPSAKSDYVEHMRTMARIKEGDLKSVDPEYLEQMAEIILGGEGGVPQALELISMLV